MRAVRRRATKDPALTEWADLMTAVPAATMLRRKTRLNKAVG
jgi:hypothetical protein